MKVSSITLLPVLAGVGSAIPVGMSRRQANVDLDVLQFALTLEHLENVYYKTALQRFDQAQFQAAGFDATFFQNMQFIVQDEEKHVKLLEGAITAAGAVPVKACTYNFGVTDINSFVTLSTVLEGVGTSAYLGGAPLLQNKDILTTAGAILVTEALHTSQQRAPIGLVPAANDLGTPLDANSVFTLASGFIVECPADNAPLPFKANPKLTVDTSTCPPPASAVLFKREPTQVETGLVGFEGPPDVQASQVAPADPAAIQAAQQQVQDSQMADQNIQAQREQMLADPQVQALQHEQQMLEQKKQDLANTFAPDMKLLAENVLSGSGGAVVAARPCPFVAAGSAPTFNAEADIPQGSFVTYVSGLSVISGDANIIGKQATAFVPEGIMGQSYVFITNRQITDNKLPADAILFGPAILEVQPPAPVIDFGVL